LARAKSSLNSSAAGHEGTLEELKMLADTLGFEWVQDMLTSVFAPNGDIHVN